MKSVPRLIRRFAGILAISSFLVLFFNLAALFAVTKSQTASGSPYTMAREAAEGLTRTEEGFRLEEAFLERLEQEQVWAVFIDNDTHRVEWSTENLPSEIPLEYSLADISALTLGYVKDYPTYAGAAEGGLLVLGYPKTRYWKSMWPTWDYDFIANLPKTILLFLAGNILVIFLIYVTANARLLGSVGPIIKGIQALAAGEEVHVREKGLLSELAVNINRTARILASQKQQLGRKETARANWIAGVSHDIRTPLSMVMGYAGQLREDPGLGESQRQKAAVIVRQSQRMKNLIHDLNLASKLEYNMQPVHLAEENLVALVRQVVVDFINLDPEGRYPIFWETSEELVFCPVQADKELVKRAVSNLIQNCINHNEQGCQIHVEVAAEQEGCRVSVLDDGVGATREQMEAISHAPHYMVCDENTAGQRHGLGLLIVKQILAAHGGRVEIVQSRYGGFGVILTFFCHFSVRMMSG